MTRRALIDCTLGPLQRHAARLLWAGRRESTKVSYSGKWRRFVDFCTITLPSEYGMHPRQALPASMSTVLLYLSHLSQEGEVREGSLNPYLAAINQMHQDAGFRRPALGHYVDLLRKGFANVEAQETSSAPARMPLPPAVVHDILTLGLASSDNETLRQTACIVLCYCWFNRADTGVLLRRSHVSFDKRGVAINAQGKTVAKNRSCPVFRRHAPDFDPDDKVCRLLRRWHDTSASWQHSNSLYWSLPDEKPLRAPMVGEWLAILLRRTSNTAPAGGAWLGHSLRVGAACASLAVGASLMQIMHYGLWKSLAAVQRYLEHFDAISPDSSAWLFFGWMTPPMPPLRTMSSFNAPTAPAVLQAQPQSVSPSIDLSDALAALLEIDD